MIFSQKFQMQTYLFWGLSKRSLVNLYYNVLLYLSILLKVVLELWQKPR